MTDRKRKPITADVRVASVQPVGLIVTAQLHPLTAQTMAAADAELRDYLLRDGGPTATITSDKIRQALAATPGVETSRLVSAFLGGTPIHPTLGGVRVTVDQVAVLGGSSYTVAP